MNAILKFLFPSKPDDIAFSLFLLVLRIIFGAFLFSHGLQKLLSFSELSSVFPDPLGVGSELSLALAIFGELFCSLAFILGILYRLALIPMIFTMGMVVFVVLGDKSFSDKELPVIYLSTFILMYISGPGKFAFDRFLATLLNKRKRIR